MISGQNGLFVAVLPGGDDDGRNSRIIVVNAFNGHVFCSQTVPTELIRSIACTAISDRDGMVSSRHQLHV